MIKSTVSSPPKVTFEENEAIIADKECALIKTKQQPFQTTDKTETEQLKWPEMSKKDIPHTTGTSPQTSQEIPEIQITLDIPLGQVSQIMGLMNFLQKKYQTLNLQIIATDGTMSNTELSDRIKETLRQLGIDPEIAILIKK